MSTPGRVTRARSKLPLRLMRWLLLAVALTLSGLTLAGIVLFPAYATRYPDVLAPTVAWSPAMTLASLNDLGWSAAAFSLIYALPFGLNLLISASMAILMLLRRSDHWFGLAAAAVFILLAQGGDMFLPLFGRIPGIEAWFMFSSSISWQALFLFFLVFPDGRFVPRWTIWSILGWLGVSLLFLNPSANNPLLVGLTLLLIIITAGSQAYRYFRHADVIQRQQTKWVVGAFLVLVALVPLALINVYVSPAAEGSGAALLRAALVRAVFLTGGALIPLSMGMAILRYRLWDIDVIIRKTLVYAVLTALLGLVYAGSVILLQQLFESSSGQQSPLAIVLSTLAIAALFNPLRRRVQNAVDRRFYRRKVDAAAAVAGFATVARDETDVDALASELARVVQETMQPETISVWMK